MHRGPATSMLIEFEQEPAKNRKGAIRSWFRCWGGFFGCCAGRTLVVLVLGWNSLLGMADANRADNGPREKVSGTKSGVPGAALEYVDSSFENASPVWYERAGDGAILIYLLYDHERASPNRAAGHIHFRIHAPTGARLTLEFRNLDNVWNGRRASIANELHTVVVSEDGRDWRSLATEVLEGNRVRLRLEMPGPSLYVARVEP